MKVSSLVGYSAKDIIEPDQRPVKPSRSKSKTPKTQEIYLVALRPRIPNADGLRHSEHMIKAPKRADPSAMNVVKLYSLSSVITDVVYDRLCVVSQDLSQTILSTAIEYIIKASNDVINVMYVHHRHHC